jgi:signal transduction histidine kinase
MRLNFIKFDNKRFIGLFVLAICLSCLAGFYFIRYVFKPVTGLVENYPEFISRDGKILFSPKAPFSPAVKAGLLPNQDYLLKIEDKPVRNLRELIILDAEIKSYTSFAVIVLRNGQEKVIHITPVLALTRPDWFLILLFTIVLAFLAFHLIFNEVHDSSFLYIILSCLFYMIFTCVKPFYYESIFSNLLIHLGKVTSWLLVLFALYFIKPLGTSPQRRMLKIVIAALYTFFTIYRLYLFQVWNLTGLDEYYNTYKFWGQINNIADGVAYIILFVIILYKFIKAVSLDDKKKLEWFISGCFLSLFPYFVLDQVPIIFSDILGIRVSIGAFANFFLLSLPLFLFIGLIKKKVVKIQFFLIHYAIHFMLAVILLAFFTIAYSPTFMFLKEYFVLDNSNLSLLTTFPFFIVLFLLRFLFSGLLKRYFYKRFSPFSFHPSQAFFVEKIKELNYTIEKLSREQLSVIQQAKDKELRFFIKGLANRLKQTCQALSLNLLELDKAFDTLSLSLTPKNFDPYDNLNFSIDTALANSFLSNRQIKDIVGALENKFHSAPSIPMHLDFSLIIKKAIADAKYLFPDIQIISKFECEEYINIVPKDIVQIILNILQNAYEVSENIKIKVRTYTDYPYCVLDIWDNGPGSYYLSIKEMFLPFTTTKSEHLGLGLYSSKLLIEKHQGKIEFKSKEGRGVWFRISFPLIKQVD